MKINTVPVFILKIDNKYYWQIKNAKGNSIICRPNSKGHIPVTVKGAKNSFWNYAQKNKIKNYTFYCIPETPEKLPSNIPTLSKEIKIIDGVKTFIERVGGIATVQTQLL